MIFAGFPSKKMPTSSSWICASSDLAGGTMRKISCIHSNSVSEIITKSFNYFQHMGHFFHKYSNVPKINREFGEILSSSPKLLVNPDQNTFRVAEELGPPEQIDQGKTAKKWRVLINSPLISNSKPLAD